MIYTLDFVIFRFSQDRKLEVLLLERDKPPFEGQYALPGGWIFEDQDKTLEDAFHRIVAKKVRHPMSHFEQVLTVGSADRDPRGWSTSTVYMAFMENPNIKLPSDMKWLSVDSEEARALPFDHSALVSQTLQRLSSKAQYSTLPVFLFGPQLTLARLERVYEIILGGPVNKAAFRKRFEKSKFIFPTDDFERVTARRPARIYNVSEDAEPEFFERLMTAVN